jgi:mono/diheme cytochrome c family protein
LTEIPEHLLKRSKERRAALGLPGGEGGGGDAGAGDVGAGAASDAPAAAPAKAEAKAPAKVEETPPPPPKPKPEYIQAAERRKRIPYWAMPVLVLLPVWAFVYADGVTPPPEGDEQLVLGEEIYPGSCGTCHGPTGGGGTGPQLSEGEVLKTFPDPVAMMEWVHLGAEEWVGGTTGTYGDPNREGGPHDLATLSATMPGFGDLTAEELAGVTRYIREDLSGEAPASPELQELYHEWADAAIENAEAGEVIYRDVEPDQERIDRAASGE